MLGHIPVIGATSAHARENRLLAALSSLEPAAMRTELELIRLTRGDALYERGARHRYVYFPTTAAVSLLCATRDGAPAELAVVGNEGLIGLSLLMSGEPTHDRAVVSATGAAYRLAASPFRQQIQQSGTLQQMLLRYSLLLVVQVSQTAVCNRFHTLEQQLCRWLLRALDRVPTDTLDTTHETIAHSLGVRRESVTETATRLKRAGLLRCGRGSICVLSRAALEARSCECYDVVKTASTRLLYSAVQRAEGQRCLITH